MDPDNKCVTLNGTQYDFAGKPEQFRILSKFVSCGCSAYLADLDPSLKNIDDYKSRFQNPC